MRKISVFFSVLLLGVFFLGMGVASALDDSSPHSASAAVAKGVDEVPQQAVPSITYKPSYPASVVTTPAVPKPSYPASVVAPSTRVNSGAVSNYGMTRRDIKSMPILERPNRPGHFYGNTVRRRAGVQ